MREAVRSVSSLGFALPRLDNMLRLACHASAHIAGCVQSASFACKPSPPHSRHFPAPTLRLYARGPKIHRTRESALVRHRLSAPHAARKPSPPHSRPTSFCCSSVIMRLSVVPVAAGNFAPSPAAAEFVWWKVMLYFSLAFGGASFLNPSNSVGLEMPKRVKVLQGPRPDSVGVCCFRSCFEPLSGTLLPFPR